MSAIALTLLPDKSFTPLPPALETRNTPSQTNNEAPKDRPALVCVEGGMDGGIVGKDPGWKGHGMATSREPNERYHGGSKDSLFGERYGRVGMGRSGGAGGGGEDGEKKGDWGEGGGGGDGGKDGGGDDGGELEYPDAQAQAEKEARIKVRDFLRSLQGSGILKEG